MRQPRTTRRRKQRVVPRWAITTDGLRGDHILLRDDAMCTTLPGAPGGGRRVESFHAPARHPGQCSYSYEKGDEAPG
jgi:hypothetical protein